MTLEEHAAAVTGYAEGTMSHWNDYSGRHPDDPGRDQFECALADAASAIAHALAVITVFVVIDHRNDKR